jgi:hypothetical protein
MYNHQTFVDPLKRKHAERAKLSLERQIAIGQKEKWPSISFASDVGLSTCFLVGRLVGWLLHVSFFSSDQSAAA